MENVFTSVVLVAGAWNLGNGVLHDIFVLRSEHGRHYDRNLLRLLMDGHILITCGTILLIAGAGLRSGDSYVFYMALAALVSLIGYCLMIFPFLKSIVTLSINTITLIVLIISLIKR